MLKKVSPVKESKNLKRSHMNLFVQNWHWLKKKSGCFSLYRPPTPENLAYFFEELIDCLSKGSESYENFIILDDFNIDVKVAVSMLGKIEKIFDLFNLTNLKHEIRDMFY